MNQPDRCALSLGMIDISVKNVTQRKATATVSIRMTPETFSELKTKGSPKGHVWETARIAAILAAKGTPGIIPLCHPIALEKIDVNFIMDENNSTVRVEVGVMCQAKTGAEMEALTAAAAAALTIYDMMKWKEKGMIISDLKLLSKSGGKSGDYQRKD